MAERNVFGERVSRAAWRDMVRGARRRAEIIAARIGRRELLKSGLLTASGYLVAKRGLSTRWESVMPTAQAASPPVTPFVEPLPIMPIKTPVDSLDPVPQLVPNLDAGEARTRPHQALFLFPPVEFYQVTHQLAQVNVSPNLPVQNMWGYDGIVPGPTYVARYGRPILVRNMNQLPADNGGFGINSVSTHLHNGHTPSESDGFPCDYFDAGTWYDQHYPNMLAGILSTHKGTGDINEAQATLWYHDHRIDFTSQNAYKGLAGFYLLFNDFDTGDEESGFRLPSFPDYDIPIAFADKVFDPIDGTLMFDLFNLDGVLGDTFLANGKVQPFLQVHPRRYRFRWLNTGPSRFYELFLTDAANPGQQIGFYQISSDGNLLPRPSPAGSISLSVGERADVIIDFSTLAGKSIYVENRLLQTNGQAPTTTILPAGKGNQLMRIDVVLPPVADHSRPPSSITKFYDIPSTNATNLLTRTLEFSRDNGQWTVNQRLMNCNTPRFTVALNSAERWLFKNISSKWAHPIHVHFEEHQVINRDGLPPPLSEQGRKDVTRLLPTQQAGIFMRFRDFTGRYLLHCHNLIHEDHAMMIRFDVEERGDRNANP